jgi:hypothetical protein
MSARYRYRCGACHKSLDKVESAPMLRDEIWHKLADEHRLLCANCVFARAVERGIDLTFASLKPCAFNLFHSPSSWFDLFMSEEKEPPPNIMEWRTVASQWPTKPPILNN